MSSPAKTSGAPSADASEPSLEIILDEGETRTSMPAELPALGRIGRYELLGRMAVGGMAEIYLARERAATGGSRHLVVKVIRPQLENAGDYEAMFLNEGHLALRLGHPNICHLYEFGTEHGRIFIAMELVHGTSFHELVKRAMKKDGAVPIPILVRVASQVAEALHSAHVATGEDGRALNIVHRDVSPHNVLVGFDGVVKLLDFGVAAASTPLGELEESGTIKGKFSYLSPEQCVGDPIDARADIFSLGVCLWEGLTGRRLFKRSGEYETLHAIVKEELPPVSALRPEVPPELEAIVLRALAKQPDDRFASAQEMQNALEAFLTERRELVNTPRVARYLAELFGDDIASGPKLDCRPHLFTWAQPRREEPAPSAPRTEAAPEESPPASSRRALWAVLGAIAVIGAGVLGWQEWRSGESSAATDPRPETRVTAPPAAADDESAIGGATEESDEAPEETEAEAGGDEAVADSTGPEPAAPAAGEEPEETEAQRRRRQRREWRERARAREFVEDPGF